MTTQFKLPELGENVESGVVTSVLVSVGDTVDKDQPVIELETDKAVVEVPCENSGTVSEIRTKEGDELKVGDVILVLDGKEGAGASKRKEAREKKAPEAKKKEEVKAKKEKVVEEEKKEQEEAEAKRKGEAEEKAEAQKVEAEQAKAKEAKAQKEKAEEEKGEAEERKKEKAEAPAPEPTPEKVPERTGTVRAAPSVRRLAREIGIDIHAVQPSSPGAAITSDDVKAYARSIHGGEGEGGAGGTLATAGAYKLPNFEKWGSVTREKMSTVRRMTGERTAQSWSTVPHVTQNDKADITELEKFRKEYGKLAEQEGGKLTVTAILVRVLAEGLKRYPMFNASVDAENAEIVYKEYYNVGVAVDTEWGLLVPSIKNADKKSLIDIAVELSDISDRARQRKTSLDELQGSCMTITNLGGIGGTSFTPIVNLPEVAILGVSRASTEPVYVDGEFVPRSMMPISLSYDHRVIDGADAARFARWMCRVLEQPMTLFLEH